MELHEMGKKTMASEPVKAVSDPTSLDAAQANVLASSQAMCVSLNNNLVFLFMGAFNDWCVSVNAGRIPNTNPPKPMASFVVVKDAQGWSWPDQSGPPVVDATTLIIPPDRTNPNQNLIANQIDIGAALGGGW
jgi:hypothetical protein